MTNSVLIQMKGRNLGQSRVDTFTLDPDIRAAKTPPSALYHEPTYFTHQQDAVFARSWHLVGTPVSSRRPDR